MRSFTPALIAATLVTIVSAAPLDSKALSLNSVPSIPGSVPDSPNVPAVPAQLEAEKSVASSFAKSARHEKFASTSKGPGSFKSLEFASRTADQPSVSVIFTTLQGDIQDGVETLTNLDSSNISATKVIDSVTSLKSHIEHSIAEIRSLIGLNPGDILASVGGGDQSNVLQIATLVGGEVSSVLTALDHVNAVSVEANVITDVKGSISDLGAVVTTLVTLVVSLVPGVSGPLAQVLGPVGPVISTLGLQQLTQL